MLVWEITIDKIVEENRANHTRDTFRSHIMIVL